MPKKGKSVLKCNYRENYMEVLFVKIDTCHSNPKTSSTAKMNNEQPVFIHYLCIVCLILQKPNIKEVKLV